MTPMSALRSIRYRVGWHSFFSGVDLMTDGERRYAIWFSIVITISKLIELGSLTSVMPTVAMIIDPSIAERPGILNDVREFLGGPTPAEYISLLVLVSGILIVVGNICEFLVMRQTFRFCAACESRLARDLIAGLTVAPYQWHASQHSVMLNRVFQMEISAWSQRFLRNALLTFNHVSTIFLGLLLVVAIATFNSVIILAGFAAVIVATVLFVRPRTLFWGKEAKLRQDGTTMAGSNFLTGSREFKFSADDQYLGNAFGQAYAGWATAVYKTNIWGNIPGRVLLTIGQVSILAVAYILWVSGISSAELSAQMAVLLLIVSRVLPAATQLTGCLNSFWGALPWVDRIRTLCASIDEVTANLADQSGASELPSEWSRIELKNVSFAYTEERGRAVSDVSLVLAFGHHYGLIGPSGSGKSTLIDLVSGLLRPSGGKVLIDDVDLATASAVAWRSQIGYVPQRPFFSDDTIRNNVAYGVAPDNIHGELVWQSLKLAALDGFVRDLPKGLDMPLGERGAQLSGGQLQRLAIARALYKQPRLLILDEATNGLDVTSEAAVLETIDRLTGNITILSVSHLASAVASCSTVYALSNGCLSHVDHRK